MFIDYFCSPITKKSESKHKSRRHSSSSLLITKSVEEDAISQQMSQTAAILSNSKLAGTFGLGIKAVTSITTVRKN